MKNICYLCGLSISGQQSNDHVVPKQLIKRKQPKVKGFDYAGMLPSHPKCNNQFPPEIYCQKALWLLSVLQDDNCMTVLDNIDNPNIKIKAINSDYNLDFSKKDLKFFKLIDVRNKDIADCSNQTFFKNKPMIDPLKQPLFVSLSVFAKSAAALLVSRKLKFLPTQWRIIAIPYYGKDNTIDFDELVGNTKPFDIGVKVWLKPVNNDNWWVIFKAFNMVVFMFYWFSCISNDIAEISPFRSDAQCFEFQCPRLVDLINYQWKQI